MKSKFIYADCMNHLPEFKDNHFDLALIDPPYGLGVAEKFGKQSGEQYGRAAAPKSTYTIKQWDKKPPDNHYFRNLLRVSKNQIVWGANHFISQLPHDSPCWIVWDKDNGDNHFADCELAWTSFNSAVRKFDYTWNGMIQGDMKNKEIRIHPTQKPVVLYRWLLQNYAKPGDLILDSHVGSGSSLVACIMEGFDYIGYEIDKEYYDGAMKRIKAERQKIDLFK